MAGLIPLPSPPVPSPSHPAPERPESVPKTQPRAPRSRRPSAPPPTGGSGAGAELQLAISRVGVGLELATPLAIGPLTLSELAASLPNLRFPVDVSGGVARFRHRRGVVERLLLEVSRAALEAWAAPRLRGVIGIATPRVMLFVRRGGATVGVVDEGAGRCLAFEVELDREVEEIALSVHDARGVGLAGPPTGLAVRALHAALGEVARRNGARFVLPDIAGRLARHVFPDRGARAPDARGLVWGTTRGHDDVWLLIAQRGDPPAEPSAVAILAREACALAEPADDAVFAGDLEKARALLVDALERAPTHRELSVRLAELDHVIGAAEASSGGRAEAALATLRDSGADAPLLLAELLRETGDPLGAIAAFARAGETEPVGPLAALAYDAAATLSVDPEDALFLLDRAIARAPTLPGPRWTRLGKRLLQWRVNDARADAEHLEALATGTRARHAVWVRAGVAFREAGWRAESAGLFERALRYRPRDVEATAGLGSALVASGKVARGAELLTQAVDMAETGGREAWGAHLDLACVLADRLEDKPAAIARVREIPAHAAEALAARGLEGTWRAALGDMAGAGHAFARARDLVEARLADLSDGARDEALRVLLEASHLEGQVKGDWLAAQRHLSVALRVSPRDEDARAAFREAGRRLAGQEEEEAPEPSAPLVPQSAPTWTGRDPLLTTSTEGAPEEAHDHARVEDLVKMLQADPTDDTVVDELATRLLRLGRTHELFALLAARLDEAGPERRDALLPKQREVLERLEDDARAAGRRDEAALYCEARGLL